MPGPHGLAVRIDVVRPPANSALQLRLRPPHPAFNARDDRETPLSIERGTRRGDTDFGKNERGIFFEGGLDRGMGLKRLGKLVFWRRWFLGRGEGLSCAVAIKIGIDLPDGRAASLRRHGRASSRPSTAFGERDEGWQSDPSEQARISASDY
jgi:hypothetical protein